MEVEEIKSELPRSGMVVSHARKKNKKVLNLSELAEKYAHAVPFRFRVVNGFMAENEKDPTIGVDEVYSVHLVKERKVVMVNSVYGEYGIPVNSTAKFGLIQNKESESMTYETVDELLNAKSLPKVVAVRTKFVSADSQVSFAKNEILIVRNVKLGRSKSGLVVYSTLVHKEMVLFREYDIQFTVDPHSTQLYLTDLLDNSVDFISCSARIFMVKESWLSRALKNDPVVIERLETQRSVVVSLFRDNPTSKRKRETTFIDIPTTIDIRIRIIKTEKSDETYQKIFKESQALLTDYNPSKIQVCVDAQTDAEYMTQAQLFAEIRKEKEKREIAESAPEHYQTLLGIQQDLTGKKEESDSEHYQNLIPVKRGPNTASLEHYSAKKPTSDYEKICELTKDPVFSYEDVIVPQDGRKPSSVVIPQRPPPQAEASQKSVVAQLITKRSKPRGTSESATKPDVRSRSKSPLPLPNSAALVQRHSTSECDDRGGPKEREQQYRGSSVSAHEREMFVKAPKPPVALPPRNSSDDRESKHDFPPKPPVSPPLPKSEKESKDHELPPKPPRSPPLLMSEKESKDELPPKLPRSPLPRSANGKESKHETRLIKSHLVEESAPSHRNEIGDQLKEIQETIHTMMKQMDSVLSRQTALESEVNALKSASHHHHSPNPVTVKVGMSPADVLHVLENAGLSQYQDSFSREAINGDIFMLLDNEMLADDLGVASRFHRVRILKLKGK